MNFIELKKSLADGVQPVYLVHGSDNFLVNKAVDLITGNCTDRMQFNEGTPSAQIITACNTLSMFGGRRVIVAKTTDAKDFTTYCKNPSPDCTLIIIASKPVANMNCINCNPIEAETLTKLVRQQASAVGLNMTDGAIRLLIESTAGNFSAINNELTKLQHMMQGTVDEKQIESVVAKNSEFQIYELGNVLLKRNIARAEEILSRLRATGSDDYAIFASLVSLSRRLFYALSTTADGATVATVLKCNPYAVTATRRDGAHLKPRAKRLYTFALDLEYKIKSGVISDTAAVTLMQMALSI